MEGYLIDGFKLYSTPFGTSMKLVWDLRKRKQNLQQDQALSFRCPRRTIQLTKI